MLTQPTAKLRIDDDHSLAALRRQIDAADDAILELLDRRQRLAQSIHAFKADRESGLALRPDRESFVLERVLGQVAPAQRPTAQALWRELLSAGLAAQAPLQVVSWSPHGLEAELAARLRFGAAASYRPAASAEDALRAAERDDAVAVLGLDREHPWWAELPQRAPLWIFEALAGFRGRAEPAALAVGRIPERALARGVSFRVSVGGDSGAGARGERVIASGPGRRLYAIPDAANAPELDRALGYVGCAPPMA
jgi:chorismate mutase